MTVPETAWQAAESAAGGLGPEADVLASADSAGLGQATMAVLSRAARQPTAMAAAAMRFWTSAAMAGPTAVDRLLGMDVPSAGSRTGRGATPRRSSPSGRATWPPRGW